MLLPFAPRDLPDLKPERRLDAAADGASHGLVDPSARGQTSVEDIDELDGPDAETRPSLSLKLPSQITWAELSELKNSLPSSALIDTDATYLQDASAFLLRLGRMLHVQGTDTLRLEEALAACAVRLGVEVQVFSTPTSLFVAVGDERVAQTHLVRVSPGEVNLAKLADLNQLIDGIARGEVSLGDAFERLDRVASAPPHYPTWLMPLAFAISAAAAACFLRGRLPDVALAGAIGLLLGGVSLWMARDPARSRVFPAVAGALAGGLASWASRVLPVSDGVTTLASLIVLLPGLSLTVAMSELATQHLMSGTARFAGAVVSLFQLALGVALSRELIARLFPAASQQLTAAPLPAWAELIALGLAPVAFAVLFRARKRDIPWIIGTGVLGFSGARIGASWLGPELGVLVGAFIVALVSNLLARRLRRPASVTLVPGLVLLVPGSIGFRSLSSFIERDVLSGTEGIFRMFLVATSLVGGLLLANAVLPPRSQL